MHKKSFGIFIGLLFLPVYAHAAIQISEVAWMGTTNSSTNEWIELYNNADTSIDVTGWKIYTKDKGIKETALNGNIPGKSFYLLERTDDTTLPNSVADTIYTGDLSNAGESLILVDSTGNLIQELNYVGGWPAGDNTTKDTMQWNGSTWVTAGPTPKSETLGYMSGTQIPIPQVVASANTTSSGSYGASVVIPKNTPHIEFDFPEIIYTHVRYDFKAVPVLEYTTAYDGYFVWNMGDGASFKKSHNDEVSYRYQYPGEYTISFAYYHSSYEKVPVLKGKQVIEVVDPTILLNSVDHGNALQIKNTTNRDMDISGWVLTQGAESRTLPEMFIIDAGNTVTIPKSILNLETISQIALSTPDYTRVATTPDIRESISVQKEKPTPKVSYTGNKKIVAREVLGTAEVYQTEALVTEEKLVTQNRTKKLIFGAVLLTVIGLLILLERFMVQKE